MSDKKESDDVMLGSWDPMRDDYNNSELNKYVTGPGAGLTENNQVESGGDKRSKLPYLVFMNTPKDFNSSTIRSILKDISINDIQHLQRTHHFFVYFNSIADMEESFRKLERVAYTFTVEVGNRKKKEKIDYISSNLDDVELPGDPLSNSVNLEARTILLSNTNPKHPQFKSKNLVDKAEYEYENSVIMRYDPKRRYLNARDEHELERCGLFRLANIPFDKESEYMYRAGRTILKFIAESEATMPKNTAKPNTAEEHQKIIEKFKMKQCCACGEYCSTYCPKCLSRFCDASCQQKMYDKHNNACDKKITLYFDLPPQIELSDKFNENHMPVSGCSVQMTAFEQSNVVYVRSLNNIADNNYFDVLQEIQFRSANAMKLEEPPKCGDVVLLKLDEEFLRAMVLNAVQPKKIKLVCIDYGNVETQPIDKLHTIPKKLAVLPRYAVPVELKDVPNCFMSFQYRQFLYDYLSTHTLKIKYSSRDFSFAKGMYCVELFDSVLQRSLNKCLKSMLTPVEPTMDDEIYFAGSLEFLSLPTGQDIELIVMDNSLIEHGFISVTTKEFVSEIEKFQKDVQAYGESIQTNACYAPQRDELCIAKYETDGKWCRGRCLELVGDGYPTILFVDYGNISAVSIDNIRRYPSVFMYPLLTNEVDIKGVPTEWNDEQIKKYQDIFSIGSTIKHDVEYNKDTNIYSINLI